MQTLAKLLIIICVVVLHFFQSKAGNINIVPIPWKVTEGKGTFVIQKSTRILVDETRGTYELASVLAEKIRLSAGIVPKTGVFDAAHRNDNAIIFTIIGADMTLGKEGYLLEVTPENIFIRASSPQGMFYGLQSLLQLLPADFGTTASKIDNYSVQAVTVKDKPRFAYRGLHLDVGRHIYPVSFIKKYIDLMALYKINTFHWHLTEDQGWRIEIKKYPQLTSIGSMRKGTQIGQTFESDNIPYGGFYTREEASEIVKYASERFITVIPEIEMPGHSVAALAAYPELSCTGGPFEVRTLWGVSDDIYCAGNEQVFTFLEDVLTEIMEIFPSKYIHIGGDEAPHDRWKQCPKCQARIKNEGLKDEAALQSYFIKRIEKFLHAHGRKLIGWDEILEGGLAPDATVMAWRGIQAGIDAANQQHDVIMTPVDYCYFDYAQGDPDSDLAASGSKTTLRMVYSYNPIPPVLSSENARHIIGVQGNVWTEHVKTPEAVEIKAFPRAIALAEVAWSMQANRNWDDFLQRLDYQFPRLDALNVKYSAGSFVTDIQPVYNKVKKANEIVITSETRYPEIRYTIDNSNPDENSTLYTSPIILLQTCNIKSALFKNHKQIGPVTTRNFIVSKAFGKPVSIISPYSFKYPASGDQALTDGQTGGNTYKIGWQGYEGTNMEFVVDLENSIAVNKISLGLITGSNDWVLLPEKLMFYVSVDGSEWRNVKTLTFDNSSPTERKTVTAEVNLENESIRYIKVQAINPGKLPAWHPYHGEPSWIFADELIVE